MSAQSSSTITLAAGSAVRGTTAAVRGGGLYLQDSILEASAAAIEGNTAGGLKTQTIV